VEPCTEKEADTIFRHALTRTIPDPEQALKFKSAVLYELCLMDHAAGWVQQFHLGAVRNINRRMYRTLGPDTGYDFIGDFPILLPIARLLARLDDEDRLARTIIYPINPADLDAVATLIGCFQDGTVPGKIQLGSAWWFLDQLDGIERQLDALSNMGLLSRFVGMLTDSRSFLSYPRHDYFRRVLCNLLGGEMERGLIPCDMNLVGGIVADISYYNARRYFDFFGGSQPAG
jgi:glucuronate isomerase